MSQGKERGSLSRYAVLDGKTLLPLYRYTDVH